MFTNEATSQAFCWPLSSDKSLLILRAAGFPVNGKISMWATTISCTASFRGRDEKIFSESLKKHFLNDKYQRKLKIVRADDPNDVYRLDPEKPKKSLEIGFSKLI